MSAGWARRRCPPAPRSADYARPFFQVHARAGGHGRRALLARRQRRQLFAQLGGAVRRRHQQVDARHLHADTPQLRGRRRARLPGRAVLILVQLVLARHCPVITASRRLAAPAAPRQHAAARATR